MESSSQTRFIRSNMTRPVPDSTNENSKESLLRLRLKSIAVIVSGMAASIVVTSPNVFQIGIFDSNNVLVNRNFSIIIV